MPPVVHWTYPMGKTQAESRWEPLVKEFNATWPQVEVDVVVQPWKDRQQSLVTAITSRTAPDVVYFTGIRTEVCQRGPVRSSIQSCLLGRTEPAGAMAEAAERVDQVLARD